MRARQKYTSTCSRCLTRPSQRSRFFDSGGDAYVKQRRQPPRSSARRAARAPVLVVVDPASTGAFIVAERSGARGGRAVWSDQCGDEFRTHPTDGERPAYAAELDEAGRAIGPLGRRPRGRPRPPGDDAARDDAGAAVRPSAVIAGSETACGCRTRRRRARRRGQRRRELGGPARQARAAGGVRAAGLRAVKQALCDAWAPCERFVVDELGAGADSATDVVPADGERELDGVARARLGLGRARTLTRCSAPSTCAASRTRRCSRRSTSPASSTASTT